MPDLSTPVEELTQAPFLAQLRNECDRAEAHYGTASEDHFQRIDPEPDETYWGEMHNYRIDLQNEFAETLEERRITQRQIEKARLVWEAARDRLDMFKQTDERFRTLTEYYDAVQTEAYAEYIYQALMRERHRRDAPDMAFAHWLHAQQHKCGKVRVIVSRRSPHE